MGPFSIIQMMCGQVVRGVMDKYHGENRTILVDEETLAMITPSTIASILTLTIGLLCVSFLSNFHWVWRVLALKFWS